MVLTKQLQVLIQSSLAQGRDYEDIREILMKQGFQESDITDLFSNYRGGIASEQAKTAQVKSEYDNALSPTELGIYKAEVEQNAPVSSIPVSTPDTPNFKEFVHPKVKKDFIPIGFEEEASAQKSVQNDVTTFMNVGTNTQTAKDILSRQETSGVKRKLPAPGTTLLPNEIANMQNSANSVSQAPFTTPVSVPTTPTTSSTPSMPNTPTAPKVFNEQGVTEEELAMVKDIPDVVHEKDPSKKYINVGLSGMPEIEKVLREEQAKKIEKSPWSLVLVLIFVLAMIGGFAYWWFFIFNKVDGEMTEGEKLLQEIRIQKETQTEAEAQAKIPVEPSGPVDPFTGAPLDNFQ